MMDDRAQSASDFLTQLWRGGRHAAALPPELRPDTRADAYAIQALGELQGFGALCGWKIAATSLAGQQHIAVDGPLAGRLYAGNVHRAPATLALGPNRMRVAEVEFVFRMGRDLPPRDAAYSVREVMDAVAALHLGIEVPDSRFTDFTIVGAAHLIADHACADRFVLGDEAPALWRDLDLAAHAVEGRLDSGLVHAGQGGAVLGDPRVALAWLVNELSCHGVTLAAGHIVTTGTCVVPVPIAPGDRVTGDFGVLGRIQVAFTA